MIKTTCQICQQVLEGDLDSITKHVLGCARKSKKKNKKTQEPKLVPSKNISPIPTLPLELKLTKALKSQNANTGRHWYLKDQERKEWIEILAPLVAMANLNNRLFDWSDWILDRRYMKPKRKFDYGNLVGGGKHLLDALKNIWVIYDDNPDHMHVDYQQHEVFDPADVGTFLTLINVRP